MHLFILSLGTNEDRNQNGKKAQTHFFPFHFVTKQHFLLFGHFTLYTQPAQQQQTLKAMFLKKGNFSTNCATTSSILVMMNWKQKPWSSSLNTLILKPKQIFYLFWLLLGGVVVFFCGGGGKNKIKPTDRTGLIKEKAGSDDQTLTALLLYSAAHTVHMTA